MLRRASRTARRFVQVDSRSSPAYHANRSLEPLLRRAITRLAGKPNPFARALFSSGPDGIDYAARRSDGSQMGFR